MMQNLSFQATQSTPLKNLAEPSKRNDTSTENTATGDVDTPFQLMLSKQLQAQSKSGNSGHVANEPSVKSKANKNVSAATNVIKVDDKSVGDLKTDVVSIEKAVPETKTLLTTKDDADDRPEEAAINTLDNNASALSAVMNLILKEKTQVTTVASPNPDSQPTSRLEATNQNQQGLVAALNSALPQGKNIGVTEQNAQDTQIESNEMPLDRTGKAVSDEFGNNKFVPNSITDGANNKDLMLSRGFREVMGDEVINAVKDNIRKDTTSKDMITPASHQPITQIDATNAMQQAASTNSINAYPGKTGWDQAISQKVVWMVGAGEQSATLTLNPPDLGPLQVVINVNNDMADTTFISDNAEVRQALQDGISNLREKMSESGIQLGQANISSGGQSQQEFQQATHNRLASQPNNKTSAISEPITTRANTVARVANGLVDTFV